MRFTNVDLLRTIAPGGLGWRRHVAGGRVPAAACWCWPPRWPGPSVDTKEPLERATVMLAIDVSLSMQADDVAPTRIEAAQEAAKAVRRRAAGRATTSGLVSFAKAANVLVSPTKDRAAVTVGHRRAAAGRGHRDRRGGVHLPGRDPAGAGRRRGRAPPARIVLLSDGYRTSGRSVEDAAAAAAAANVPVSTIAFGTDSGTVDISGQLQRVPVDRLALQQLAETDRGLFYEAASVEELQAGVRGHGQLDRATGPSRARSPSGTPGSALLLALCAGAFSLLWTSRLLYRRAGGGQGPPPAPAGGGASHQPGAVSDRHRRARRRWPPRRRRG